MLHQAQFMALGKNFHLKKIQILYQKAYMQKQITK